MKSLVLAVVLLLAGACGTPAVHPDASAKTPPPVEDATTAAGLAGNARLEAGTPHADARGATDGAGGDGVSGGPADAAAPDGPADTAPATWPAVTDYGAVGPFAIGRDRDTGPGGAYDVFRPANLTDGRRHPIISWANGTLFALADYQKLIEHWASHGFVIIAGHTNTTAGGGTHKAGIDWLLAENARAGSPYAGALDPKRIGAAGHSQGGGATIAAGADKPGTTGITATLPLMPLLSFESDATIVKRQTAPMLNINATRDNRDPAGAVASAIFSGATKELVQVAYVGVHEDAMNVAMHRPTLAWFRWRLMDDEVAAALFTPDKTCGLCNDPAWQNLRWKNHP
jgi:predicted dienelactone hydrolase